MSWGHIFKDFECQLRKQRTNTYLCTLCFRHNAQSFLNVFYTQDIWDRGSEVSGTEDMSNLEKNEETRVKEKQLEGYYGCLDVG